MPAAALAPCLAPRDPVEAAIDRTQRSMPPIGRDPRDPDPTREGIFVYHNCYRCQSGKRACVRGDPRRCEFPHARND